MFDLYHCTNLIKYSLKFAKNYETIFCHNFTVNTWLEILGNYPSPRAKYYVRVNNGSVIVKFSGLEGMGWILVNHEKKHDKTMHKSKKPLKIARETSQTHTYSKTNLKVWI